MKDDRCLGSSITLPVNNHNTNYKSTHFINLQKDDESQIYNQCLKAPHTSASDYSPWEFGPPLLYLRFTSNTSRNNLDLMDQFKSKSYLGASHHLGPAREEKVKVQIEDGDPNARIGGATMTATASTSRPSPLPGMIIDLSLHLI